MNNDEQKAEISAPEAVASNQDEETKTEEPSPSSPFFDKKSRIVEGRFVFDMISFSFVLFS